MRRKGGEDETWSLKKLSLKRQWFLCTGSNPQSCPSNFAMEFCKKKSRQAQKGLLSAPEASGRANLHEGRGTQMEGASLLLGNIQKAPRGGPKFYTGFEGRGEGNSARGEKKGHHGERDVTFK